MLGICSLASGSKGNATLIQSDNQAVLIDCGISCKKLMGKFDELEFDPQKLNAIFVTHEHGDHISGIRVTAKKLGIPVYANVMTNQILKSKNKAAEQMTVFDNGAMIPVGDLVVEPFSVPHDGVDTVAYIVYKDDKKVAVATDFGFPSQTVKQKLQNCDAMILESNYDQQMLMESDRPWSLKQRIMGRHGHLSNEQCLEMMDSVVHSKMKHLVLGHVSMHANDYGLVHELAQEKMRQMGLDKEVALSVGHQDNITPTIWV